VLADSRLALAAGGALLVLLSVALSFLPRAALTPTLRAALGVAILIGIALILVAMARYESARRTGLARAAALAERHRIARDLHDGIAQDLAFIAAHGASLTSASAGSAIAGAPLTVDGEHPIAVAARRALAVTRGVIGDLADPEGTSVADALHAVAYELGTRFQMTIVVDVPADLRVAESARRDLLRIVREAIANAARHGQADRVTVTLARRDGAVVLRIRDDGRGLRDSVGRLAPEGFGIASMRDRAAMLGGALAVRQPDGGGTELVVTVP
jgi:signal transduction histidine kinase